MFGLRSIRGPDPGRLAPSLKPHAVVSHRAFGCDTLASDNAMKYIAHAVLLLWAPRSAAGRGRTLAHHAPLGDPQGRAAWRVRRLALHPRRPGLRGRRPRLRKGLGPPARPDRHRRLDPLRRAVRPPLRPPAADPQRRARPGELDPRAQRIDGPRRLREGHRGERLPARRTRRARRPAAARLIAHPRLPRTRRPPSAFRPRAALSS